MLLTQRMLSPGQSSSLLPLRLHHYETGSTSGTPAQLVLPARWLLQERADGGVSCQPEGSCEEAPCWRHRPAYSFPLGLQVPRWLFCCHRSLVFSVFPVS